MIVKLSIFLINPPMITKNTFNTYIKNETLQEGVHYDKDGNKKVFIPDAIVKLKKVGVKGKRKTSEEDQATLEAVNAKLGIISECRHVL